ncbi:MAG: FAD-dependent oxidoreductase [Desulfarculaceae bacterium]
MFIQTSSRYPHIFSPLKIKTMELPNRLVMAPMATSFAGPEGEVTDCQIAYYRQRAKGGVGLIIVENANIDFPVGVSGATQLRADKDRFIPGLFRLTQAIHQQGTLCALQLNHAGALAKKAPEYGAQAVAPSPAAQGLYSLSPHYLEADEIPGLVRRFAQAALRAQQAGFDAVQIHGAHAYLIAQFLSPLTNTRTDQYGGDSAGRARFALEIVRQTRSLVGPDYPLIFRLNAEEFLPGGMGPHEAALVAEMLQKAGVDCLDLTVGTHYQINRSCCSLLEPMSYKQSWRLNTLAKVKKRLKDPVPIIGVGPFRDAQTMEKALQQKKVDLASMGRPLIADPKWPAKVWAGEERSIRHCISCNEGCVRQRLFENKPIGCAVNPEVGWEKDGLASGKGSGAKVLVVGGGPAGCAAAIYAAQRGNDTVLIEQTPHLGGACLLASRLMHKHKLAKVVEFQRRRLRHLGVELRLETPFSLDLLDDMQPRVLAWAAGARPMVPAGIQISDPEPLFAEDAIASGFAERNQDIALIGGGAVGCELSLTLAHKSNRVTVLEALDSPASQLEPLSRFDLLERMQKDDRIRLLTRAEVRRVDGNLIQYQEDGRDQELAADRIIWSTGHVSRPLPSIPSDCCPGLTLACIGDARRPRNLLHAVREGFWFGVRL